MIYNFGSINIDLVYHVPHFPAPGETLHSSNFSKGLGGKGANMSIAIAKAGGNVRHIGAIGDDGLWTRDFLKDAGVNVDFVKEIKTPTGHAVINVDDAGENSIVLFGGANRQQSDSHIARALADAAAGDWLLLQNETNLCDVAADIARQKGMKIAYAAAPFDPNAVASLKDKIDLIAVNEIEAEQLIATLGKAVDKIEKYLVTKGSKGIWYRDGDTVHEQKVFPVNPVDTTGAGDTYLGYFLSAIDAGAGAKTALQRAAAASSIQISRHGAATAIPDGTEVDEFLTNVRSTKDNP